MNILSFFTDNGIPAVGLSPTVKIRDILTGLLTISGASMIETGDGFYNYDFVGYNYETNYAIVCDGGNTLADAERYVFAGNENYVNDIDNVLDTNITLSGIQADLDNPDQYKADVSELALETTVLDIKERTDRIPDSPSPTQEYDVALSGIPSAVWNEFAAGHTVSGTFGKLLSDIKVEVDAITIKLPEGDIAESGEYTTLLNNIEIYILRNLGLSQENYYLDQTVYVIYQDAKLLTEGRIRIYSDAASVGTDSNIIATYIIAATWTDDKLQTYKVVKQ